MPRIVPLSFSPTTLAVEDFNDDDVPDVLVASLTHRTIAVLLSTGAGLFHRSWSAHVNGLPNDVVVGDFDGDDNPDAAVATSGGAINVGGIWVAGEKDQTGSVAVFLGDGTGGLSPAGEVGVGVKPSSITTADFNHDGALDLAVANVRDDSISILLGNGGGGFSRTTELAVEPFPSNVDVGDFNTDGHPDLVVIQAESVSVLLGDGEGGFALLGRHATYRARSVAIGDLNGDDREDLALATLQDVAVLLGDGAGRFVPGASFRFASPPAVVAVGDLNDDSTPDLVAVRLRTFGHPSGMASIMLGNGGGFLEPLSFPPGVMPRDVGIGDFDDDGKQDLVFADSSVDAITFHPGDARGGFKHIPSVAVGKSPWDLAIGLIDGDRHTDLITANLDGGSLSIYWGDGTGNLGPMTVVSVPPRPVSVVLADFSNDGRTDLAVSHYDEDEADPDRVSIHLQDALGGFDRGTDLPVGTRPTAVAAADLDDDGVIDLVVASAGPRNDRARDVLHVFLGNGGGTFTAAPDLQVGDEPYDVAIADFDHDGAPDLVVASKSGGSVDLFAGSGLGTFAPRASIKVRYPRSVVAADFNLDGRLDLGVAAAGGRVYLGVEGGRFGEAIPLHLGTSVQGIATGDFSGDGIADLALVEFNRSRLTVLAGDGDGRFTRAGTFAVGHAPRPPVAGDIDGDGRLDLSVPSHIEDRVSILLNRRPDSPTRLSLTK